MKCLIDDCERQEDRRGFCNKHYRRWMKYGDAEVTPYERTPTREIQEFILKALSWDSQDCLIWPYGKDSDGYPWAKVEGKTRSIHRYVCEKTHGSPVGDRDQAAHECGNPSCVSRKHLSWKTRSENMMDKHIHLTMRTRP